MIDSILRDRPIPLIFLQRQLSAQSGRSVLSVVDGQQRLRAIFEFLDDRVLLSRNHPTLGGLRFSQLPDVEKHQVLNYELIATELIGYSDEAVRDTFIRLNQFVVRLSPQELRHAKDPGHGHFAAFVEKVGSWPFWLEAHTLSPNQVRRMRSTELAAELVILLLEGPQDKKDAIDLYYTQFRNRFPFAREVRTRLTNYFAWIQRALPSLQTSRFRKPVDLYGLIGALDRVASRQGRIDELEPDAAGRRLGAFEKSLYPEPRRGDPSRYAVAASRQTDNLMPRTMRISILEKVLAGGV